MLTSLHETCTISAVGKVLEVLQQFVQREEVKKLQSNMA